MKLRASGEDYLETILVLHKIINKFKMLGKPENSTFSGFF